MGSLPKRSECRSLVMFPFDVLPGVVQFAHCCQQECWLEMLQARIFCAGDEDLTKGLEGRPGSIILALLQVCFVVPRVSWTCTVSSLYSQKQNLFVSLQRQHRLEGCYLPACCFTQAKGTIKSVLVLISIVSLLKPS